MDNSKDPNEPKSLAPTSTSTDDESITTSTASGTLDSWTLVTDKKIPKTPITAYEDESNIEDLPRYEDLDLETLQSTAAQEEHDLDAPFKTPDNCVYFWSGPVSTHVADTTSATDEFSDEVSIISESESGEVLTPHPYLIEHLQKLNLKFTTGEGMDLASLLQQQQQEEHRLQQKNHNDADEQTSPPNTPVQQLQQRSNLNGNGNNYQTRQRKRRSPSVDNTQKALRAQATATPPVPNQNDQAPGLIQRPLIIRRVYTLLFYSIVAVILIGVYGKLGFLEWPMIRSDSSKSYDALEKKLIDMELQNNLMRAEIDLLTKQVNHIKTNKQPIQNNNWDEKVNQPKNGKKPYLRGEQKVDRDSSWKTYENSNTFKVNEANHINGENRNPPPVNVYDSYQNSPLTVSESGVSPPVVEKQSPTDINDDFIQAERFNDYVDREATREFASKKDDRFRKRGERGENFKRQNKVYNSKERNDNDGSGERRRNFKKGSKEQFNDRENSKERMYRKQDNEFKRNNDKDSKERYRKNDNNSKDRKFKRESFRDENNSGSGDNSKEDRLPKIETFQKDNFKDYNQKRKSSHEKFDKEENSGEWHWKLMKQRENARNEQEERVKKEKNWYLNQKDGREQWRTEELKHR